MKFVIVNDSRWIEEKDLIFTIIFEEENRFVISKDSRYKRKI